MATAWATDTIMALGGSTKGISVVSGGSKDQEHPYGNTDHGQQHGLPRKNRLQISTWSLSAVKTMNLNMNSGQTMDINRTLGLSMNSEHHHGP